MKIICVGRNYIEHIEELNNERPKEPLLFMKPDTALLLKNAPFVIPDFSNEIHYEVEVVVKICKVGKYIEPKFAHKYYDEVSLGIDFTARDLQSELKSKGMPWEKAKAFDQSALVGDFFSKSELENLHATEFELFKNDNLVQQGCTSDMIWGIDELISNISKYFTLKTGDLIFTGTPSGVGRVDAGDVLMGKVQGKSVFEISVK